MPIPIRTIEVSGESEQSWEDAAALAVKALGRQLVKNIDSLHLESSDGHGPHRGRYEVEARISLKWKRLEPSLRIAG